jgi:pseudaminic acid synthase
MVTIANRRISKSDEPFIIAEMSGNHNQSLERALKIVDAAANSGVHALKLQTYTPDTMTLNLKQREFLILDDKSPWKGRSLWDLYQEAYTPWDWHEPIFRRAKSLGLMVFSTPFDETAVDFLENLDVPCYKIASFENTDLSLIRKVASTGKPVIISTGMATIAELDTAVRTARECGCPGIILLKCTSSYPASPEYSNLKTISHMRKLFGCEVGLSDHTLGIGAAITGVALGATIIEKHFTLSREDGGVDSLFSLEPAEMQILVEETRRAWNSLGKIQYGPVESEKRSITFRRSLYIVEDLKAKDVLTKSNLRCIRPGLGLAPQYFDLLIGRRVLKDVKMGTPASWDLIM